MNPKDDTLLMMIAMFLTGFFLYLGWLKVYPKLIKFYLEYRLVIAFALSVSICFGFVYAKKKIQKYLENKKYEESIAGDKENDHTFLGFQENGKPFSLNVDFRRMHAQVVGTTNAGKTESVLVPLMVDDIQKGRGLILIDGKSDMALLHKIHSYAVQAGREHEFKLFSLTDYAKSQSYNPLIRESVDQAAEKTINSFNIEHEFYRTEQFDAFKNALAIFKEANEYPTFLKLRQALADTTKLMALSDIGGDVLLKEWALEFHSMKHDKRRELISGLLSNLGYFASKDLRHLFNVEKPQINIGDVIEQGHICYFQLPVLKSPILGKAVAKMVLQDIQAQVSKRHASGKENFPFFGIYLDDFTEYLTKSFVSVLNKSRSTNIGVTFAHQALGDLEALGKDVKNQIQTNANIKVFMRTNEPESTEYFAKTIGTTEGVKTTSRQKVGAFGRAEVTADGSVRDVEEFITHPNEFKRELGRGEGIVIVPHVRGAKTFKVKFQIRPNLPKYEILDATKDTVELLKVDTTAWQAQSSDEDEDDDENQELDVFSDGLDENKRHENAA